MKKISLMVCALVAAVACAKEQVKDEVTANATNAVVQTTLSMPDGVSIVRNEKDGSLQVYARGSSSYDFGDARDIRSKTKVAEMRAKAALSKYVKEIVAVEEGASESEGRLAKSILTKTRDGDVVQNEVARETVESVKETLTIYSAAILSGVATLKTVKIPAEGNKTSGEIQVTVGISTKTLAAAKQLHNMITDSLNTRRDVGERSENYKRHEEAESKKESAGDGGNNKVEVRINDTLF